VNRWRRDRDLRRTTTSLSDDSEPEPPPRHCSHSRDFAPLFGDWNDQQRTENPKSVFGEVKLKWFLGFFFFLINPLREQCSSGSREKSKNNEKTKVYLIFLVAAHAQGWLFGGWGLYSMTVTQDIFSCITK